MIQNVELADRVIEQVTLHPETHCQQVFSSDEGCGTVACIAGWAVILAGQATLHSPFGFVSSDWYHSAFELLGLDPDDGAVEDLFYRTMDKYESLRIFTEWTRQAREVGAT